MQTIKIKTSGTHCPSCSMLIEMNVTDVTGVESVKSSHADGVTTVTFDPARTDAETIATAVRDAGYGAEVLG